MGVPAERFPDGGILFAAHKRDGLWPENYPLSAFRPDERALRVQSNSHRRREEPCICRGLHEKLVLEATAVLIPVGWRLFYRPMK